MPESALGHGTSANETIEFTVRYRFCEWLAFVRPSMLEEIQAEGKLPGRTQLPWWVVAMALPMLGPIFFYKKFKLPVCTFSIGRDCITRQAGGSTKQVAWSEVKRVKAYPPGYLLCMEKGGMPIPFRCLAASQRSDLERLFATHGLLAA